MEKVFRRILGRRLARAHHAIDFDQRLETISGRIDSQRVRNVGTAIEFVDPERFELFDTGLDQRVNGLRRQFVIGRRQQFATIRVDDIVSQDLALEVDTGNFQLLDTRLL